MINKRQLKKLSKIAMQAVIQSCDWLDEGHFDEDYVCCADSVEAEAIFILANQYTSKAVTTEFDNKLMVVIAHYPNIKHLSFANKIHFMANYLKRSRNDS